MNKPAMDSATALSELRALVTTYLEGSDDAPRAAELVELLGALAVHAVVPTSAAEPTTHAEALAAMQRSRDEIASPADLAHLRSGKGGSTRAMSEGRKPDAIDTNAVPDDRARVMFGCTATAIDQALAGKCSRDVVMYAMGMLSDAQELISGRAAVSARDANTIRQRINIAKYAINSAVPR